MHFVPLVANIKQYIAVKYGSAKKKKRGTCRLMLMRRLERVVKNQSNNLLPIMRSI